MTDQLQRYVLEKQITPAEYEAALMYYGDHLAARRYLRAPGAADRPGAERYREACRVLGDLRPVVHSVVIANESCSMFASRQGTNHAVMLVGLRTGLGRLTSWYSRRGAVAAE